MSQSFILGVLSCLLLSVSCRSLDTFKINDNKSLVGIEGRWRMTQYEDYKNQKIFYPDKSTTWFSIDSGQNYVNFKEGKMEVKLVSNILWGNYKITNRKIVFTEVFSSYEQEPKWSDFLRKCIPVANKFLVNNKHLRIYCKERQASVLFEKVQSK